MTFTEKRIYDAIDEILWKDWDPIGINDNENIRDEYRSYTPYVFRLKMTGADAVKIAEHLHGLVLENMGMQSDLEHCKAVARKIYNV
ncbi:hypothetical protein M2451_001583 [Dysgonomonas sp. PFB1-18]|jgi:hypothetical protein|uniref:hypothetical protein n=1 Tax=unclassified Dysgonomonas TaxID=2630389 RepID=UPI0024767F9C|nr:MULTISPECIES: hypothetical protein [unclassified Dysgonomonas]MDH6308959.1 hypothetical protein [Dysgonomonas sp. PF1-14]MDH6338710.1 hypothetical protein [Dysgonomonas sp. PF1-16]MDH6380262.1 hypothetical protein [Dysgonomonas sp. PFB1-18]MDH6397592.1 hypothetical protein [Dysgonomonas sp. PF1-23]